MNYRILMRRRAQGELASLDAVTARRIQVSIWELAQNPRPRGSVKLTDREGWRIRVGRYRILYDIDDVGRIVTVLRIGHRREIYR